MWNFDFVWFGGLFLKVNSGSDLGIWNEGIVEVMAKNTGDPDCETPNMYVLYEHVCL